MAKTTSLAFPKMFNVAQNRVDVLEDETSVSNRVRLLMLTDPTEVYNEPEQGCGLKEFLFKYNTPNQYEIMKTRIRDQLRAFEPQCDPDKTQFAPERLFTGKSDEMYMAAKEQKLDMTVAVKTLFGSDANINFV